ncbi:MAG: hypothetical protein HN402_05575 [Candidatus Scalindua sp.]|nr:hypothetical protein [Candidatus Scalindua sp.]
MICLNLNEELGMVVYFITVIIIVSSIIWKEMKYAICYVKRNKPESNNKFSHRSIQA